MVGISSSANLAQDGIKDRWASAPGCYAAGIDRAMSVHRGNRFRARPCAGDTITQIEEKEGAMEHGRYDYIDGREGGRDDARAISLHSCLLYTSDAADD